METHNPWGQKLEAPRNPVVDLLKAYGKQLHARYKELEGRVVVTQRTYGTTDTLSFYILNLKLHGYNTRLLSIEQPLDAMFPIVLRMHYKTYSSEPVTIKDVQELDLTLRRNLASAPVQNIIEHVLALGNTMEDYRTP